MSDCGWSLISYQDHQEQQIDSVIKTQEARFQTAKLGWTRLGTSRTQVAIEEPPRQPPPLLPPSATTTAPVPSAAGAPTPLSRRNSKKAATAAKEFPRTEESEKAGREPTKGSSLGRKIKNSLLGGKNPYKAEKERQEQATGGPLTQSPEPDMVLVRPGMEPNGVHAPQSAALASMAQSSRPQRQYKPPPVTSQTHASYSSPGVYSSQTPHSARGSSASLNQSSQPPPPPMRHVPPSSPPRPKETSRSAWAINPSDTPATSQPTFAHQYTATSQPRASSQDPPPTHELTHYCHGATSPLISENTRLTELKEDYRDLGSEGSEIMRSKINYLRFELGYRGLRRARGDGNCFYRSFAFAYLEQIFFADDRAIAVINALEHLEMAQKLVELAMPGNVLSSQMHLFMQDLIRGMGLQNIAHKMLVQTFQDQRDSDNIVAYVRLLASAYIRLTPEMHGSVFHPDDPSIVISPPDFCSKYVEQLGQDANHVQITALSRTLNVPVRIYYLDERVDGIAPHKDDIPAHCTRFIPTGPPVVTDPVSLLFRPGLYDVLERVGPPV